MRHPYLRVAVLLLAVALLILGLLWKPKLTGQNGKIATPSASLVPTTSFKPVASPTSSQQQIEQSAQPQQSTETTNITINEAPQEQKQETPKQDPILNLDQIKLPDLPIKL